MTAMTLTETRIRAGVWEAVVTGAAAAPALEVLHQGRSLTGVEVAPVPKKPGVFTVRAPIPNDALSDGVQTFLIRVGGEVLAHFTIVTGQGVEGDLRAELDLMRDELDLLKRAFRQHCVETGA